ncbi:polysaccharide deacetylase family protein [Natronospora cellulosivora (SeqCode)]
MFITKRIKGIILFIFSSIIIFNLSFISQASNELIILGYHHIVEDETNNSTEILREDFLGQMKYLYDNDYKTLFLDEVLKYYFKGNFPEKSVLITFDDGYRSFLTKAYPILKEYNLKATVFPIVAYRSEDMARRQLWSEHLSFHDMRFILADTDLIEIGSHSFNLHYYTECGYPAIKQREDESFEDYYIRIERDLRLSKDLLLTQLDREIRSLSWPYGISTIVAEDIAKDLGFDLIFTTERARFSTNMSLHEITRIFVEKGDLDYFISLLK